MRPLLQSGAYALFRPARRVRPGQVVLVEHLELGSIVKQVSTVSPQGLTLCGLSPASVASEALGQISPTQVRGVLLTYTNPPRPSRLPQN